MFSPVRGENVCLVQQAPLPAPLTTHSMVAVAVGTGMLARQGLDALVDLIEADRFPVSWPSTKKAVRAQET